MNAQIINIEIIEATEMSCFATIISLDSVPSLSEMQAMCIDESVILEF